MAEVKKIATRESYGNALAELGKEYPNLVVLDADLAAATKTGIFKKAFPDRHIDCGIAECNMVGIAAGLATTGKIPFVSSFAMFAAGRAFEQVRNSVGYPKLNVKIGATHAGISVGEDGATHQGCEDLVVSAAKKTGKVVTIEEHSIIGGLGSAVCDCLCAKAPTPVYKIGVNDTFGESGPAVELLKKYELDSEGIYKKVKAFVEA